MYKSKRHLIVRCNKIKILVHVTSKNITCPCPCPQRQSVSLSVTSDNIYPYLYPIFVSMLTKIVLLGLAGELYVEVILKQCLS